MLKDEDFCPLSGTVCRNHKCHELHVSGVVGKLTTGACDNCIVNLSELRIMEPPKNPKNLFDLFFGGVKSYFEDAVKKKHEQLIIFDKKSKELGPCPQCGMTLSDIAKAGRMGCPTCYSKFSEEIKQILIDLQSDTAKQEDKNLKTATSEVPIKEETTKEPITGPLVEVKYFLSEKLSACIKTEDYESATILRDLVKLLNSRLNPS